MDVLEIAPGLWRWTAYHEEWKEDVGCVYVETEEGAVLIDPLVPPEDTAKFWKALDRDVEKLDLPIVVLIGSVDHGRAADRIAKRYDLVAVLGSKKIDGKVSCRLTGTLETSKLPSGVEAHPIVGMMPGETAFFLRKGKALTFSDAVIGCAPGQVAVAPISWGVRTPAGRAAYTRGFRRSIAALLESKPSIVLPSHGEPVLRGGAKALRTALESPAWGD
jgi:glyoxylase-like metal-dependent hydrolase (beta-lactamase superfamily II)